MAEELGKIEKPNVDDFKAGRKLFFVPLVFSTQDLPQEYADINNRYWEQVESQLTGLENKLGKTGHIFHELVPESGQEGLKTLKQLKVNSLKIVESRVEKGAVLESTEDDEILAELMDWSRCLSLGLQSQKVYSTIYAAYSEVNNKRNEAIAQKIDLTIQKDQSAIMIMGEGHHVRFPADIQLFYVAPPALDELKRWLRDYEAKLKEPPAEKAEPEEKKQA
jgi:hypothetical protein